MPPEKKVFEVYLIGHSWFYQAYLDKDKNSVDRVAELQKTLRENYSAEVHITVIAKNGAKLSEAIEQLKSLEKQGKKPDMVLLCTGGNDFYRPKKEVADKFNEVHRLVAKLVKTPDAFVIFNLGPIRDATKGPHLERGEKNNQIRFELNQFLTKATEIQFADLYAFMSKKNAFGKYEMQMDEWGVHPKNFQPFRDWVVKLMVEKLGLTTKLKGETKKATPILP